MLPRKFISRVLAATKGEYIARGCGPESADTEEDRLTTNIAPSNVTIDSNSLGALFPREFHRVERTD